MGDYRYCPRCGAEYRADVEECSDCLLPLGDEPPARLGAPGVDELDVVRADAGIDPDVELVEVYSANSPEAEMVRGYLEGHGVPAIMLADDAGAYELTVGPMGNARVLVRDSDVADAHALIMDVNPPVEDLVADARLGIPTSVIVAIAIVIVVGLVVAYMPGR